MCHNQTIFLSADMANHQIISSEEKSPSEKYLPIILKADLYSLRVFPVFLHKEKYIVGFRIVIILLEPA